MKDNGREGNMLKNLIILGLLIIIMTGATASDVVAYVEDNQLIDKFSEMLYNIVRSVKNVKEYTKSKCDCDISSCLKCLLI